MYQNPFIYWYNHKNEKSYDGPRYETPDETLVVGGGLASIDVVKVLQLENYERALKARGIQTDMHELEKGIPAACKAHGIEPEELGRERVPADLPPPRAGHAAGAASRQRDSRADREDRAGPAEDASPGARQIPVSVSGSQTDGRPRRRERAAGRLESGGNQSRRAEGRTDSRLGARTAGSSGDLLDRVGAGVHPRASP